MLSVIGCGNPARSDDGAGYQVIQKLMAIKSIADREDVSLYDAGTDGMAVMYQAKGSDSMIIIDACQSGAEAGAIFEVPGEEFDDQPPEGQHSHAFRWDHAIYAGRRIYAEDFPLDATVYLIEAQTLQPGLELSEAVANAADKVVERIKQKIADYAVRGVSDCGSDRLSLGRKKFKRGLLMMQVPGQSDEHQKKTINILQAARELLASDGSAEEIAECDLNLGLALHMSSAPGSLPMAIQAYQRGLRGFTKETYPREFAILQSNLASAYLATPVQGNAGKMREALAVQAFEAALEVINIDDYPSEYGMLQNNLGNALQYASSGHALQNNYRALAAYQEALKVRSEQDSPVEYANTLSNMANCLSNLPDDPESSPHSNPENLQKATELYRQAIALFESNGEIDKARLVNEALNTLEEDVING